MITWRHSWSDSLNDNEKKFSFHVCLTDIVCARQYDINDINEILKEYFALSAKVLIHITLCPSRTQAREPGYCRTNISHCINQSNIFICQRNKQMKKYQSSPRSASFPAIHSLISFDESILFSSERQKCWRKTPKLTPPEVSASSPSF